jgi:F-type H+-transporting ATPase subunit b
MFWTIFPTRIFSTKAVIRTMPVTRMTSTRRIVRTCFLAMMMVSCVSVVSLYAQKQAAPPAPKQATPEKKKLSVDEAVSQSYGPGRQLVHGSNEAAGEGKDEMAEFKESASVRAIGRLTGLNLQQSYWLSVVLNFLVIAGAIVWAGRKYLPGMFRDRSAAIQKAMHDAQMASEEARRRLAEIESRLMKLDSEIGRMREAAEKEGAAEEARIKAAAEEDARKIIAAAEQEIAAAVKAARRQLTAYAADLAVGLARKQIHVDAATDQALVRNFAGQLGASDDLGKRKDRN